MPDSGGVADLVGHADGVTPDGADAAADSVTADSAAADSAATDSAAADSAATDSAAGDSAAGDSAAGDSAAGDSAAGDTGATADTTPAADTLSPDSNASAQAFCAAFGVTSVYCNDLSSASLPAGDTSLLIYDPYSGGLQTTSWLSQGYGNAQVLADGALRFAMHDGAENDTGVQFPMPGANLATQLNVGFVMRMGANFLPPHTDGAKFVVIQGTTTGTGWRPTLFLVHVTDTQGRFGAAGSRYWVFVAGDDAGGLMSDEFGWEYPQDAYTAGNYHTFRLNNYVGQWIYVEYEVVASGMHKVYVATPDGAFDGLTPLAQIQTRTVATSLPWQTAQVNAYTEASTGTSATSTVDVDLLQIDSSRIGPPPGFFD